MANSPFTCLPPNGSSTLRIAFCPSFAAPNNISVDQAQDYTTEIERIKSAGIVADAQEKTEQEAARDPNAYARLFEDLLAKTIGPRVRPVLTSHGP